MSGAIGVAAGVVLGATTDASVAGSATLGGLLGLALGNVIAGATNPSQRDTIEWNRFEEDEADRIAMDWLLERDVDVLKVPDVYFALRDIGDRDSRVKLGFLGRTDRVRERLTTVQARIEGGAGQAGVGQAAPGGERSGLRPAARRSAA